MRLGQLGTPLLLLLGVRSGPRRLLRARISNTKNIVGENIAERSVESDVEAGHCYFVSTPIGHMGDISERAKSILAGVDYICCEDTRHSGQLLHSLGLVDKKLLQHHEHNLANAVPRIVQLALQVHCYALPTHIV